MTGRILLVLAVVLNGACTDTTQPADRTATANDRRDKSADEALAAVVLPVLSPLAESVQRQIRDRHAVLTQTIAKPGASPSELAAAYGALGRVLMAAQFHDEAATCYLHAETLVSDDGRWPYYLGHAYLRKGERDRAADAFQRALTLRPGDVTTLIWLGETYLDDGRLDVAQSAFGRALAVQPQSAAALFGAGRTALARRAYSDAVQNLERALAADNQASAIHYPLAMAYRALGDREKADAHLRQRGTTFPDLPDPLMQQDNEILDSAVAHETRGMQALKNAQPADAAAAFRKGLALEPADPSLRYWLGAALYAAGDLSGAAREFSAVAQQSPEFAKAHFSLGMIEQSRGHHPAAIERFRKAAQADPTLPEARFRLADALRATGQLQASIPEYEAAIKLDPGSAEAWIGGAQALIALGRVEQATEWLSRARRLHPARPELAQMQAHLKVR
jgi:tetratricopeptide (TPR) repeat protein